MTSWKNGMMEDVELGIYGIEELWMCGRMEKRSVDDVARKSRDAL